MIFLWICYYFAAIANNFPVFNEIFFFVEYHIKPLKRKCKVKNHEDLLYNCFLLSKHNFEYNGMLCLYPIAYRPTCCIYVFLIVSKHLCK